jgi:hypothetical protein
LKDCLWIIWITTSKKWTKKTTKKKTTPKKK